MARLNDFLVTTESVESLKRRFVRQNREIARTNSMQSVRIRTLEAEISRLLVENVSLREQIISLNQDLEKAHYGRELTDGINDAKQKLEAKLVELGGLVADLGLLPQRAWKKPDTRSEHAEDEMSPKSHYRCSSTRIARETASGGDERLPVILEDRCYPSVTLDQEVLSLTPDHIVVNKSPDLNFGSHAFSGALDSASVSPREQDFSLECADDCGVILASELPSNLETRRRRRDSSLLKDIDSSSAITAKQETEEHIDQTKPGFKRKLSIRDADESASHSLSEHDDFQYTRLSETSVNNFKGLRIGKQSLGGQCSSNKPRRQSRKDRTGTRRILEPSMLRQLCSPPIHEANLSSTESANVNTSSPGKQKNSEILSLLGKEKENTGQTKLYEQDISQPQTSRVFHCEIKQNERDAVDGHLQEQNTPGEIAGISKTIAALNILSGSLMEPSKSDMDSRGTPPPEDLKLSAAVEMVLSGTARQPRRCRGAISYAEPNLRDKMRRPTKELVDAVGEDRFRRVSRPQPGQASGREEESGNETEMARGTIEIRQGLEGLATSKDKAAGSPSGKLQKGTTEFPSDVISKDREGDLSARKVDIAIAGYLETSTSSIAISALAGARSHSQDMGRRNPRSGMAFEKQSLVESSTIAKGGAGTSWTKSTDKVGRQSTIHQPRRHSSNPISLQPPDCVPDIAVTKRGRGSNDGEITFFCPVMHTCENNSNTALTLDPDHLHGLPIKCTQMSSGGFPKAEALSQTAVSETANSINAESDYHTPCGRPQTVGPTKQIQHLKASRRRSMML